MTTSTKHYSFGVEIESVVRPYGGHRDFKEVDWYRLLAEKLQNRGIPATWDDCSSYRRHDEYYGNKWFVTRDGSLGRKAPYGKLAALSTPFCSYIRRLR